MKGKFKILFLSILAVIFARETTAQQNVQFSQYVFNMLSVNPAYAGYKGDWYLNGVYRHQWVNFPGAPQTGAVSIDGLTGARDERVGVGAQLTVDKLGPQEILSAYGFYSYRIPLDEEDTRRLCIGLGGGITQYSIDGTALKYVDDLDQAIPLGKTSQIIPDARFGVYYYTPKFYVGAAVMDLFSLYTDNSRYYWGGYNYKTIRKTQHLYVNAGYLFDLSENLKLKPSIMWKEDFKGPSNFDFTAFLLIAEKLWIGGSYRTGVKLWSKPALDKELEQLDAASAMVEFYATPQLRIGYAYDITINKLASYQQGSHEISVGYLFNNKKYKSRTVSPRYF
ncbi:MAG TPA: type IX secretion system membrane protein PorP/SprF [Chitinophaga sp.]|uniref:PorP/SprF family type IX secretion system membrane protein n=1 Tax=Chitinophaga sp. TaxID=1869181 RepID=UPI002BF88A1F|nr:type IX secretion system membrane protein PorP/SprF [Chitinophaga sp.]HVI46243.1 type IX secretion system membrane protein PorP/SprF [Chitinophaga sp.]